MKRIIGIATYAVMLSALATAATAKPPVAPVYEAATDINSAGWLTAPAENGRYYVAYTGTKGMTREQVAEFALLRAAEFTAESGLEWFAVTETKTQKVALVAKDDLKSRSGSIIGGPGGASTGSGGGWRQRITARHLGCIDRGRRQHRRLRRRSSAHQVTERWVPPMVLQTVIVIQMGKGDEASFPGLKKAPEIFSAKTTAEEHSREDEAIEHAAGRAAHADRANMHFGWRHRRVDDRGGALLQVQGPAGFDPAGRVG